MYSISAHVSQNRTPLSRGKLKLQYFLTFLFFSPIYIFTSTWLFSFPIYQTVRDPLLVETAYKLDVQYVFESSRNHKAIPTGNTKSGQVVSIH